MYTIISGDESFTVDSWTEVKEMWEEIVFAEGAEDAEMTLKFTPEVE